MRFQIFITDYTDNSTLPVPDNSRAIISTFDMSYFGDILD